MSGVRPLFYRTDSRTADAAECLCDCEPEFTSQRGGFTRHEHVLCKDGLNQGLERLDFLALFRIACSGVRNDFTPLIQQTLLERLDPFLGLCGGSVGPS